jgi:CO/xanthine dehydrogenase FAD-binding subunit/thioredoxin reductase
VDTYVEALEKMGVQFKLGVNVGVDVTTADLQKSHDSVYFGTGAWKQPVLGLDGEKLTEFGLNFLVEVNTYLQKAIGSNVLVCGGGSVAMDVAVSAMRLGAKSVTLVCLEQRHEMPATAEEVQLALEEGLQIFNGWGLGRVVTDDTGKMRGLEAKKCLSVFNAEGRFSPVYDEKDLMLLESDNIILATGQRVDLEFLGPELSAQIKSPRGLIDADAETSRTKAPGIYAGGDAVTGPNIAIKAIAAGRFAAEGINKDLGLRSDGVKEPGDAPGAVTVLSHFNREGIKVEKAARLREAPAAERSISKEDTASLPLEGAIKEAERCMHCGCYAVNPSDLAPVLMALEAEIITTERTVPAETFFTSQLNPRDTLGPGELVKEIRIPVKKGVSHYDKVRTRNAIDFAILSLASHLVVTDGVVKEARLVLGGAAPIPVRLKAVEDVILNKKISEDTAAEAAAAALKDLCVMDKNEYKLAAMTATIKEALLRAAQ